MPLETQSRTHNFALKDRMGRSTLSSLSIVEWRGPFSKFRYIFVATPASDLFKPLRHATPQSVFPARHCNSATLGWKSNSWTTPCCRQPGSPALGTWCAKSVEAAIPLAHPSARRWSAAKRLPRIPSTAPPMNLCGRTQVVSKTADAVGDATTTATCLHRPFGAATELEMKETKDRVDHEACD